MTGTPFDPTPDPELGRLLRDALTGDEPEAFLARMRSAVAERDDQWDVLDRWARPRLVVSAVAAALLLWVGIRQFMAPDLEVEAMTSSQAATVLSAESPTPDDILASLWEISR
ncbi:MAG: hypothetical protein ACRENB_16440 [Gemmatimonadales bacterium]